MEFTKIHIGVKFGCSHPKIRLWPIVTRHCLGVCRYVTSTPYQSALAPRKTASTGISLIELGLVMVLMALALVPVVRIIGGPQSASGTGSAEQVVGLKSKEALLANTMVERVLSGDFRDFDCARPSNFNPLTDLPSGAAGDQRRTYRTCTNNFYNTPLYYQWTVVNVNGLDSGTPVNGSLLPANNFYYQATFNVLDGPNGDVVLTMPTYFFYNSGAVAEQTNKTGVVFAMDVSGSMIWSCASGALCSPPNYNGLASPWMFYRYDRNLFTGNSWGVPFNPATVPANALLDRWDDRQLDVVYGLGVGAGEPDFSDPDSSTPFNEKFPYARPSGVVDPVWGVGLLGTGNCSLPVVDPLWLNDPNLRHAFLLDARSRTEVASRLRRLCEPKPTMAAWSSAVNQDLSRMEAARTGALGLLLNLEAQSAVVQNIDLGFFPWSVDNHTQHLVPLGPAEPVPGLTGQRFAAMREKLLWINRADPGNRNSARPVRASGGTNILGSLQYARELLLAGGYDRRIIILLSDGDPTGGTAENRPAGLRNYTLNTLGHNAPEEERITLFTVGLIAANNALMRDMARNTPDGQEYIANDIASLSPIFESVSYQIQKLALLSTADRYGIRL